MTTRRHRNEGAAGSRRRRAIDIVLAAAALLAGALACGDPSVSDPGENGGRPDIDAGTASPHALSGGDDSDDGSPRS